MPASDLATRYDVEQTADYIIRGSYRSVALQFPDDLLPDSPAVSELLQQRLGGQARVFILADTAYNPLGVDEVAAQHLNAQCVGLSEDTRRLLRRRNFMVERARSANIVGLLVGTLGSAGFRHVISSLRRLAIAAGKKTYTFLMGKPNPAKLGNFPEELEARFLQRQQQQYKQEQDQEEEQGPGRQQDGEQEGASMALQALGGGLSVATRGSAGSSLMSSSGGRDVVAAARTAADFLAMKRTFRGLEIPATGAAPKAAQLAVEGLSGRAAVYSEEGGGQLLSSVKPPPQQSVPSSTYEWAPEVLQFAGAGVGVGADTPAWRLYWCCSWREQAEGELRTVRVGDEQRRAMLEILRRVHQQHQEEEEEEEQRRQIELLGEFQDLGLRTGSRSRSRSELGVGLSEGNGDGGEEGPQDYDDVDDDDDEEEEEEEEDNEVEERGEEGDGGGGGGDGGGGWGPLAALLSKETRARLHK
ncbi:hypothetical protein VOLCADRAFT_118233, partial [Volvox carteri f. nagariensis]